MGGMPEARRVAKTVDDATVSDLLANYGSISGSEYECRVYVQVPGITYPYQYPVCTGTYTRHYIKLYPTIYLATFCC